MYEERIAERIKHRKSLFGEAPIKGDLPFVVGDYVKIITGDMVYIYDIYPRPYNLGGEWCWGLRSQQKAASITRTNSMPTHISDTFVLTS